MVADIEHDPLVPDKKDPTPLALIVGLSREDRILRVKTLIDYSQRIVAKGVQLHQDGHLVVGYVGLFSGGNDSTTMVHLMRPTLTHAGMANTGIGIEQTRQYVRDACAAWGLPLIEKHPRDSYEDLVLGRVFARTGPNKGAQVWPGGFPGPSAHAFYFQRLKERCFDQIRGELVKKPTQERVVFVAGRRRQESDRRKDVPLWERRGSTIWVSPLALWTSLDLSTYRTMHTGMPRNQVSDLLHMSGECLCGAFAHTGELDEIGDWFPETRAEIEMLQAEVRASGIPEPWCRWGHGQGGKAKKNKLCGNCAARAAL